VTSIRTAELTKYAANAFLAVKISFINEMAGLCEDVGADVIDLARCMGMDRRIGGKFLHPGPGYGGSCFPKDTLALLRIASENKHPMLVVAAAAEANDAQKARMVKKILDASGGNVAGKTIGVLGLTFKPETDDMRYAPSITILPALLDKGSRLQVYDPQGMEEAKKILLPGENMVYMRSALNAVCKADVVVLMTEWNEFRSLDLEEVSALMTGNILVDLRNVFQPEAAKKVSLIYYGVGRQ
jgi:UDPglucose 6-dehydrogenase